MPPTLLFYFLLWATLLCWTVSVSEAARLQSTSAPSSTKYTDEHLRESLNLYENGTFKTPTEFVRYWAGQRVHMPYNTIKRTLQGTRKIGCRPGPKPKLDDLEVRLLQHIDELCDVGLSPDRAYVLWLAGELARAAGKPFQNELPSRGWWRRFKTRHPEYALRATQTFERARATAEDAKAIHLFFHTYEQVLDMPDRQSPGCTYRDRPDRIFNSDESGVQEDVRHTKSF